MDPIDHPQSWSVYGSGMHWARLESFADGKASETWPGWLWLNWLRDWPQACWRRWSLSISLCTLEKNGCSIQLICFCVICVMCWVLSQGNWDFSRFIMDHLTCNGRLEMRREIGLDLETARKVRMLWLVSSIAKGTPCSAIHLLTEHQGSDA